MKAIPLVVALLAAGSARAQTVMPESGIPSTTVRAGESHSYAFTAQAGDFVGYKSLKLRRDSRFDVLVVAARSAGGSLYTLQRALSPRRCTRTIRRGVSAAIRAT